MNRHKVSLLAKVLFLYARTQCYIFEIYVLSDGEGKRRGSIRGREWGLNSWYSIIVGAPFLYTYFPALGTSYMLCRVSHTPVIYFPAFGTSCTFQFPRLVLVTYFPAFGTGESFPAMVWVVRFVCPEFAFWLANWIIDVCCDWSGVQCLSRPIVSLPEFSNRFQLFVLSYFFYRSGLL